MAQLTYLSSPTFQRELDDNRRNSAECITGSHSDKQWSRSGAPGGSKKGTKIIRKIGKYSGSAREICGKFPHRNVSTNRAPRTMAAPERRHISEAYQKLSQLYSRLITLKAPIGSPRLFFPSAGRAEQSTGVTRGVERGRKAVVSTNKYLPAALRGFSGVGCGLRWVRGACGSLDEPFCQWHCRAIETIMKNYAIILEIAGSVIV